MLLARIGRIARLAGGIDRHIEHRTIGGVIDFDNHIVRDILE